VQIGVDRIGEALGQIAQQPIDYILEQILDLMKECREKCDKDQATLAIVSFDLNFDQ